MRIELGNDGALTLKDGKFVPMDGEHITTLKLPDSTPTVVAFLNTLDAIPYHFQRDAVPVWVKSSNPEVERMIAGHFGADTIKPRDWGSIDEEDEA